MAVDGGGFKQIPDPQRIELKSIGIHKTGGVALVHRQGHRLSGFAEHGGHILIGGGNTAADVGDHNNGVSQFNADFRLPAHKLQHIAVGSRLDAAGIHQGEGAAAPLTLAVNPVPGDARGILHDGGALAGELIEQHGLAHVGPSNNCDQGLGHENTSFHMQLNSIYYDTFPG